ncbi:hypothetical protein AALP_AA2G233000 [Arabis alpina]|uniref:Acidic protein n=1 Tax=Arabis alpina TaxID=50452 RepID=A0A087HJG2_ARAAL|nr:hypothetical protein AALP_AA2G233000 [Arabis alpina]
MEGKTVILSVLIMRLVMAQIQLGAAKSCCPSLDARDDYDLCRLVGYSKDDCASTNGCKLVNKGGTCPSGYPNDNLQNSGDLVNEYCKLGCASSVCGAITTLQSFDKSVTVDGAVAQCTKACSTLCTKGSTSALKTA